jgi:hypothetical protein
MSSLVSKMSIIVMRALGTAMGSVAPRLMLERKWIKLREED